MSPYSFVAKRGELVDIRLTVVRPPHMMQPAPTQSDERPPVRAASTQENGARPPVGAYTADDNLPEWVPVQPADSYPANGLPDWVDVNSAADTSLPRQAESNASSAVSHHNVPAQQAATPYPHGMPAQPIVLATPGGDRMLTHEEYVEAVRRVRSVCTAMGGVYCNAVQYIAMFGMPGEDRDTRFGEHVWHGMLRSFSGYVHRYRFQGGRLYLGWFRCPCRFSAANARLPVSPEDRLYYPAVFVLWNNNDDEVDMACEAILLQGARPWRVHRSRVEASIPLEEVMQALHMLPPV